MKHILTFTALTAFSLSAADPFAFRVTRYNNTGGAIGNFDANQPVGGTVPALITYDPASNLPVMSSLSAGLTYSGGVLAFDHTANAPLVADLATKEPVISSGTTNQFWRGDKTWVAGRFPNIQTVRAQTDGSGNYVWTFNPAFSAPPDISVVAEGGTTVPLNVQLVGPATATNVTFKVISAPTTSVLGIIVLGAPVGTQAYINAIAIIP